MLKRASCVFVLVTLAGCSATSSPSTIAPQTETPTITFSGLGADGASVRSYSEAGFDVSVMSGDWSARTDYGHPAPFVQFWAAAGSATTGELQVRTSGSPVYFKSVDLYSSTTLIPYTVKGLKNGNTVFTLTDILPQTFGDFRTVFNPNATAAIDTLSITLPNAAATCCRNPMGVDTIVFTSTPSSPPPVTFSLSGQVTDIDSGAGIPNADVSIGDGPNLGRLARTDASGHYTLADLLQSGFTVTAAAGNYVPQSKGVTLASSQALSFQLTRKQKTPPAGPSPAGATIISFNGVATQGPSFSTYTDAGFTVSAISGAWEVNPTYGNPAPFIQFRASPGATATGEIRVAAGGSIFNFFSVDLYTSTTPIPYTIRGLRAGNAVFTLTDTFPNTIGSFKTLANPNAGDAIDTLSIVLTNAAAPCCANPMGLDTIVLTH